MIYDYLFLPRNVVHILFLYLLLFFTFALFLFFTLYFVVFVVRRVAYRACSQASNYHKSHLRSLKIQRDSYAHSHTCLCGCSVQGWRQYYITRRPPIHICTQPFWASPCMSTHIDKASLLCPTRESPAWLNARQPDGPSRLSNIHLHGWQRTETR